MAEYRDSSQSETRFGLTLAETRRHQGTEVIIEVGIEAETEEDMDRGRDAGMRRNTTNRLEQRIGAGMDSAKDAEIERN
jgi:hypothetical protein